MSTVYMTCTCHGRFKLSDAGLHASGLRICPRCGRLFPRPRRREESEARQRARRCRQAEAAQGRLF